MIKEDIRKWLWPLILVICLVHPRTYGETINYEDGGKYVGETSNGVRDGEGTFTWPNGDEFVGKFKDGKLWNGIAYRADGSVKGIVVEGVYETQVSDCVKEREWIEDGKNMIDCEFYSGERYVGEFKEGNWHGQGTFTFADGAQYVGEFKENLYHGQGIRTYLTGSKYVGEWKDSLYHGQGTFTGPDGKKYVGEWKDGLQHGQGTMTMPDGRKVIGEWKDGKIHGQGTWAWPGGEKYVGEWKDDGPWLGTEYDKDGNVTATYVDGTRQTPGATESSSDTDEVTLEFENGSYIGKVSNGVPDGRGTATWSNGKKYVGEWKDGKKDGQGTYTWPTGGKYVGEFKRDRMNGQGTLTFADGGQYVGEWKEGEPWNGTFFDKDQTVIGTYSDGIWKEN